jgi:CBS domain-containing protein
MSVQKISLLPIKEIMRDPVIVDEGTPVTRLRKTFRDLRLRIVVVARGRRLIGLIKRANILRVSSTKSEALARDVMEDPKFTLSESSTIHDAFRLMVKYDEWYGIVVGQSWSVQGIVGMEDIVGIGLKMAGDVLGKTKVSDVMSTEVVYVKPDDTVSRIWRLMESLGYAGFPVVNNKMRLVGIITQYDLIRKGYTRIELESESGPRSGPRVSEAMTYSVEYLYPWSTLREAAELMVKRGYGRIPVVDGPKTRVLVGVVDREDVARVIVRG